MIEPITIGHQTYEAVALNNTLVAQGYVLLNDEEWKEITDLRAQLAAERERAERADKDLTLFMAERDRSLSHHINEKAEIAKALNFSESNRRKAEADLARVTEERRLLLELEDAVKVRGYRMTNYRIGDVLDALDNFRKENK